MVAVQRAAVDIYARQRQPVNYDGLLVPVRGCNSANGGFRAGSWPR
jgi:hypothetical protein